MNSRQGRIDVHHHLVPPAFAVAMEHRGLREVAGAPIPEWSPLRSLETMDANGIQTALLSLSAPGVFFGNVQQARDLARACNEYAADLRVKNPGRFGSFAVLPLPFTALACAEATYALDTFSADGVVLFGSSEGRYLGDAAYDDLMAELDARHAVVLVHPNLYITSQQPRLGAPGHFLELPSDTTRAAVNLILTGTLERYSHIRWILGCAGGFLPYVAWQVAQLSRKPEFMERTPQSIIFSMKRFYYDTALAPSRNSMSALRELVDPSHILFGSDYPYANAPLVALECRTLDEETEGPEIIESGVARGNALALFPQFKVGDEEVTLAPTSDPESMVMCARHALSKSLSALAKRIKD